MNSLSEVKEFVSQKTLAMVGLSRSETAFSTSIYKELTAKGYRLLPVNPNATDIRGTPCYPNLSSLPEKVGGVLIVTAPAQTEAVVREAADRGLTRVWIQQGAHTPAAEKVCQERGLSAVSRKCIMMFAEPVGSIHGVHRWFAGVFGQLPRA
jgi:predicted CoA-binding protein